MHATKRFEYAVEIKGVFKDELDENTRSEINNAFRRFVGGDIIPQNYQFYPRFYLYEIYSRERLKQMGFWSIEELIASLRNAIGRVKEHFYILHWVVVVNKPQILVDEVVD